MNHMKAIKLSLAVNSLSQHSKKSFFNGEFMRKKLHLLYRFPGIIIAVKDGKK